VKANAEKPRAQIIKKQSSSAVPSMTSFISILRWCATLLALTPIVASGTRLFDSDKGSHAHRSLQSEEYAISFDSVTNTKNNITVNFINGAGSGAPTGRFEIFVANASSTASDYTLSCYSKDGIVFDGEGISERTSTVGTLNSTFDFSFDREVDEVTSPFYFGGVNSDIIGEAKLILCVKFTLTESIGDSIIDVNYKEVAIAFSLTLDGGIDSAEAFVVNAVDVDLDSNSAVQYTATAALCGDFSGSVTPRPGIALPICIKADNYPLSRILAVEDLSLSSGSLKQEILVNGAGATGAAGFYETPVSDGACLAKECIQYDVLVYAVFATGDNLSIDITGSVVLGIGNSRRTLGARVETSRDLEEYFIKRGFQTTVSLRNLDQASSSGAYSTSIASWILHMLTTGTVALVAAFV
jgi:hypothetical protein